MICDSVDPHNSQRHHSRGDYTADNKHRVGAGVVLGQPTDHRDVDGDQDAEDQLEPADFFFESVNFRHRTVKMPVFAFKI